MEAPQAITVDGINYEVGQFSADVKSAIGIYNAINLDLQKANVEVYKHQAALQTIGAQIATAVRQELEDKKKQAEATPATE